MNICSIVVLAIALLATTYVSADLTEEQKAKLLNHSKECLKESGVDIELVKLARKGDITDNDPLKHYALCIGIKTGILNSEGRVQDEVVYEKIPDLTKDQLKELISKCKNVQADSPQVRAFEVYKCYHKNTPVKIVLF